MNIKKIQEDFDKVILHSQNLPKINSDDLFDKWLEAKRDFIEAFNGELIYEYPEKVYFELDKKEKELKVSDFSDLVATKYDNVYLADFIDFNKEWFFGNQLLEDYVYEDFKIPKGMKIIRAFKFFESDKEVLNELQSIASMIIQEDKIEGRLCLSVHPLDFISASENNHNWRSCHALDGDFRSGNLSYMVDKSTVICYLRSEKEENLPNFPKEIKWNSKKWRVWLFFSEDWNMMFAGRQYPFTTYTGLDFVKNNLIPKTNVGNEWSPWLKNKIRNLEENEIYFSASSPYIPISDTLVPMNELVINNPNSLQFNDLLSSSCYDPLYSFKMEKRGWSHKSYPKIYRKNTTKFKIGGGVKCLCCAEDTIELSETVMCNNCELLYGACESDIFEVCPCCGERFFTDDGYWIEGAQETICPDCAEFNTDVCECCGDCFYKEDMVYDENNDRIICRFCKEEEKEWHEEQLERQRSLYD